MPRNSDPINAICDATMRAYAILACQARPESRFAKARERLGDRATDVAAEALRGGIKAMLTIERDQVLEELERSAGFGELAARTRILGVAELAIEAVIQAAEKETS